MKACVARIALGVAGLLLTSASAGAGVLYQTGFESPTFSAGVIGSQDGWVDNGTGNAVVQATVAASGTQSLLMRNTTVDFADKPVSASGAGLVVTVALDYLHSGTNTTGTTASYGIFGDNERTMCHIGYVNGQLFGGNRTTTRTRSVAAANDVWHHLVLTADFGTLTMSATVNGELLGSLPLVLPTTGVIPAAWTELTLVALQTNGGTNTIHYFDNLVVSSAVPEPQAAALLGIAALGAFRRRAGRV